MPGGPVAVEIDLETLRAVEFFRNVDSETVFAVRERRSIQTADVVEHERIFEATIQEGTIAWMLGSQSSEPISFGLRERGLDGKLMDDFVPFPCEEADQGESFVVVSDLDQLFSGFDVAA